MVSLFIVLFFFNDPATTEIYTYGHTLSLHDALPIFTDLKLEIHAHNDFGMGVANALAALDAGADVAHASVLGLGERVGNTSLEELAVAAPMLSGLDQIGRAHV